MGRLLLILVLIMLVCAFTGVFSTPVGQCVGMCR
jgi:hypothetical protein